MAIDINSAYRIGASCARVGFHPPMSVPYSGIANEQAKDASKKLEEAKDALAKKAEELKAKEIADQAAMQPIQVNPQAAVQQVEKALEQAKVRFEYLSLTSRDGNTTPVQS